MLTGKQVKNAAREMGADVCGIGSMDRYEGAPKQQDPRYIFPDAKSCISLVFRIPRGYLRGIEEGTHFVTYTAMGYAGMNRVYMPNVQRELTCFIEDHGYEAVPICNEIGRSSIPFTTQKYDPTISRPVRPGNPTANVLVDDRVAAYICGMGEFGYSKVFLTPEFGPLQRFATIYTDAELEPDPIFEGGLCDRCMCCVKDCTGKAISATETEGVTIAGRRVEWGKLDFLKCSIAYKGGNPEFNPFMDPKVDTTEFEGKYAGGEALSKVVGHPASFGHNAALEGARGCIRACYVHLENKGVLKKKFVNKFRKRKQWRLSLDEDTALDHDYSSEGHGVE
jgi:hypothetical protein